MRQFRSTPILAEDKRILLDIARARDMFVYELLHEIIVSYLCRGPVCQPPEPVKFDNDVPELLKWVGQCFDREGYQEMKDVKAR